MNFFEHQSVAKKKTFWLFILFLLSASVLSLLSSVAVVFLLKNNDLFWPIFYGNHVIIFSISFFKFIILGKKGEKLFKQLGGVALSTLSKKETEIKLRNITEEMALASGMPPPKLWIFPYEKSINALSVGYHYEEASLGITQGAVDKCSREELQSLVAHEYSHILRGDMRLHTLLLSILYGIQVYGLIGKRLRENFQSRHFKNFKTEASNDPAFFIFLIGVLISTFGYLGLKIGQWIRSLILHQRDFLADASSVQYTRDRDSLISCFKKIATDPESSSPYFLGRSDEVSSLLFFYPSGGVSTQPSLNRRIQELDPSFDGNYIEKKATTLLESTASVSQELSVGLEGELIEALRLSPWSYFLALCVVEGGLEKPQNAQTEEIRSWVDLISSFSREKKMQMMMFATFQISTEDQSFKKHLQHFYEVIRSDGKLSFTELLALVLVHYRTEFRHYPVKKVSMENACDTVEHFLNYMRESKGEMPKAHDLMCSFYSLRKLGLQKTKKSIERLFSKFSNLSKLTQQEHEFLQCISFVVGIPLPQVVHVL